MNDTGNLPKIGSRIRHDNDGAISVCCGRRGASRSDCDCNGASADLVVNIEIDERAGGSHEVLQSYSGIISRKVAVIHDDGLKRRDIGLTPIGEERRGLICREC